MAVIPPLSLVPGRSCGTCSICCKLYPVEDLKKPRGVWCDHCSPKSGCAIHKDRPEVCRQFFCDWLLIRELGPEWKPEKCKFVLHSLVHGAGNRCLDISVDPNFPNSWRRPKFYGQIKKWATKASQQISGPIHYVMVQINKRKILVLPDKDVDLGLFSDEQLFEIKRDVRAGKAELSIRFLQVFEHSR